MNKVRLSNKAPELRTHASWTSQFSAEDSWRHSYKDRRRYIGEHAWCILTKDTARELGKFLSKFKLVIEPFAGTGYIASHLREASQLGRNYKAYDPMVSHWKAGQRPNYGFTKSGCFNVNIKAAECVVMCWPNYNQNLAYRVARKMVPGQYLVYQGEGRGGCTGDDKFHEYLNTNFRRLTLWEKRFNHKHVRWDGIYDEWHVYIKES